LDWSPDFSSSDLGCLPRGGAADPRQPPVGLLISTKAKSQFQAMQMTFFVFLPSILLSGFMFPFAGMPRIVQWIAEILPLTHFLRLIRGVMLRGAGLFELWPDVLALIAFTAVMMTLAISRFRKRLD
jgi:ABC-2 type transport system permease protein